MEQFINRGLRHFLSELAPDEVEEIKQRTTPALSAAEQAVKNDQLHEADSPPAPELAQTEESYTVDSPPAPEPAQTEDDLNLSTEEVGRGIQIGRIEMRIAGCNKRIPQKIMPDPDDPGKFCIAQRDLETRDPVPQIKRGARHYVVKGCDGGWALEKQ